jgi:hypothetical protein
MIAIAIGATVPVVVNTAMGLKEEVARRRVLRVWHANMERQARAKAQRATTTVTRAESDARWLEGLGLESRDYEFLIKNSPDPQLTGFVILAMRPILAEGVLRPRHNGSSSRWSLWG